jgi:outer membrane protein assembly factor BamB
MRAWIATCAAFAALLLPATAGAQLPVPVPPLGPPGGQPPPPEQPPPQNQPPAAQPAGSPPTGSVTQGVDAAHSGFVDDPNLVPPLRRRWTRTFSNDVRGVRSAEGKLFTVQYKSGTTRLIALDPLTGRNVWVRAVPGAGDLAYDGGRLFLPGTDGVLRAYSAADGALAWESRVRPDDPSPGLHGPPVATGGTVYVNADGVIAALRESDGAVLWTAKASADSSSDATVDGERVYYSGGCDQVHAVARGDGHELWQHVGSCSGSAGSVPMSVFESRLYVPVTADVLDASSGAGVGKYPAAYQVGPVFARGMGLFLTGNTFSAVDVASGKMRWRRRVAHDPNSFFGELTLTPVAVGHSVYGVTNRGVAYALDMRNGARIWHAKVPFLNGVSSEYSGNLEIAPGLLLVPAGRKLTAFESVYRPAPGGIAATPVLSDVQYLQRNFVQGVVGTELRTPGRRVTLEVDEPPYRRFKRLARSRVGPDGFFAFTLRSGLNLRVRLRAGKAVSKAYQVYTYPRIRIKLHRLGPTRIRANLAARTSPSIRLAGRRVSLYVVRARADVAQLLGTATLGRRGRGRGAAAIPFRALRHVGRRDYLSACVQGQLKLGLGRPTPFTRGCGRRRIRF